MELNATIQGVKATEAKQASRLLTCIAACDSAGGYHGKARTEFKPLNLSSLQFFKSNANQFAEGLM